MKVIVPYGFRGGIEIPTGGEAQGRGPDSIVLQVEPDGVAKSADSVFLSDGTFRITSARWESGAPLPSEWERFMHGDEVGLRRSHLPATDSVWLFVGTYGEWRRFFDEPERGRIVVEGELEDAEAIKLDLIVPDGFRGGIALPVAGPRTGRKPDALVLKADPSGLVELEQAQWLRTEVFSFRSVRVTSGAEIPGLDPEVPVADDIIAFRPGRLVDNVMWFFVGTHKEWLDFMDGYPERGSVRQ